MNRSRLVIISAMIVFAALFFGFPALASLLTDWWWFREIGYQVVFSTALTAKILLFLAVASVTAAIVYANLRVAMRGVVAGPLIIPFGETVPQLTVPAGLQRASVPIAVAVGVLAGLTATPGWTLVLGMLNATPFGITDPVFGRDIGYYVFTLPGISAMLGFLTAVTVISMLLSIPLHFLSGHIVVAPQTFRVHPTAARHFSILLAVLLAIAAVELWLIDIPGLLYSTTGPLIGASYTDLHARLPALRLSALAALAAAIVILVGNARGQSGRYAVRAVLGYIILAAVARGIVPQLVQKFVVSPTELTRETPYLRSHITATRQAWGLDSVELRELSGETNLTLADIQANAATVENVRLWDRDPLLQTFGQLQEIRTYYDFVSVDDDRYQINGKYRQVLLSPRELNAASLPTRTFINEHLTFTHGMGLTLAPVNQVTAEGLPVLFVKDLPPSSNVSISVTRPQLYYGELNNEYVFVKTRQREFDHPSGEENVYAEYQGTGGVPIGSVLRRIIFAAQFGSSNILFSGDIQGESRILYNRNIRQRAQQALPFLRFDRDPYIVIAADGKLKWMLDAYTTTDRYPYAVRLDEGTTYMRNSVKVVIDAYDGSLHSYVSTPNDPLIRTWGRIFPGILQPIDSMPADLRAHIRYPDELYRAQTTLYTTYHMIAPEDFYHREDQWQIPAVERSNTAVPFMRHIVMRLPEEKNAEFIYMVPFSPRGKDNLAAWMVARNDGAAYGKLRVYRLSRQSLVFGPKQIENRIHQNTDISRQISLWDQRGSQVIRGDLLVIPIESSLLYVQPLYLRAEGGRIPELKRVVVAYQNQVAMEETLDGAIAALFGSGGTRPSIAAADSAGAPVSGTPAPVVSLDAALQALIADAQRRYRSALDAQREGDWARYGEEIRQLGQVLERISAAGARSGAGPTVRPPR